MTKTTPKVVLTLAAVACLAAAAFARSASQREDSREGAPGVEVTAFEWKYEGYQPVEMVDSGKSGVTLSVKRKTRYVFKYTAQLTVRNTTAKAVKSVEWEHVFVAREGGAELKRYRLQARQQVAAGATVQLSKEVFIKPDESTRHISEGAQRVRVTRVEFADGTTWRAPGEKQSDGEKRPGVEKQTKAEGGR